MGSGKYVRKGKYMIVEKGAGVSTQPVFFYGTLSGAKRVASRGRQDINSILRIETQTGTLVCQKRRDMAWSDGNGDAETQAS